MQTRWLLTGSAVAGTVLLSLGCQAPAQPTGPTLLDVTAATPEDYEYLFTTAEDTLRDHYLRPDRRDRLEGVITTHRDTTANWFEFWRPQPRNPYYWAEANTQTIQRQATVHIRPADEEGLYELDVQVDRYRYRLKERQVDNAALALRMFSSDAPTFVDRARGDTGRGSPKLAETSYWVHLGRDEFLERKLATAILRRYGGGAWADRYSPATTAPAP